MPRHQHVLRTSRLYTLEQAASRSKAQFHWLTDETIRETYRNHPRNPPKPSVKPTETIREAYRNHPRSLLKSLAKPTKIFREAY